MPTPDPDRLRSYLAEVTATVGRELSPEDVTTFAFGDTAELADELGALVRDGDKRATAGWLDDPDEDDEVAVGDLSVVLDGRGQPLVTIRTDEVTVQALDAVDPAFAWDEGEGDRTRASWQEAHERYFRRRAEDTGTPLDPTAPRFCFERFSVVHPALEPPPPLVRRGTATVRALRADERAWVRALLGDAADARDVLDVSGGFPADRCPGLLARDGFRSTGLLVFAPAPDGVATVRTVALDGKRDDPDEVAALLDEGLAVLTGRYGWGTSSA